VDSQQWIKYPALAVISVVAAIVWSLVNSRQEAKRRKALERAAAAAGWDSPKYSDPQKKFEELRGAQALTSNPIVRPDGSCALFDYEFTRRPMGSSRWRYEVVQTVVYVRSDRLALPVMSIEPRKVWSAEDRDRLIGTIDFSDAYAVRNSEPSVFEEFPNVEARRYLMDNSGITIHGAGDEIFFFRASILAAPDQILEFANWGQSLTRIFERPAG
jgi:hypothetical protein